MMAEAEKPPAYMAQLLEALGWDQGSRIPLADDANKDLETQLINRQNELQRLKESLILQNQKRNDLNKYKNFVNTENQENRRLLFAHKQQMELEVKLHQLANNEASRLDRDVLDCHRQAKDINTRIDRFQATTTKLLKKADSLKAEVCGERGALQEWRAALERNAGDISAIEQFTKQDLSKAKALETTRQKLKLEHDRMEERLTQLVSNLNAEERACDRISVQVFEGMEQRKQLMNLWTGAVENLRQRDTDIRHTREDYAVLEKEANKIAEECREQQAFCDQQRGNNAEAERENISVAQQLSLVRISYRELLEDNATLDSEANSLERVTNNMRNILEKLHMENRQIMDQQHLKDKALEQVKIKIRELKGKVIESLDKTKSSEKRAKELEQMLNDEEQYASQVTTNQQRAMHCSFVEQQKLLELQNEHKLFHMHLKSCKAVMSKMESKQREILRNVQSQKESLYLVCYQVETIGARVSYMEGAKAERECRDDLVIKEDRLKEVLSRHAARFALLERHSVKLQDDMRRLARDLEARSVEHIKLQSRLKTSMLNVEGGDKELRAVRDTFKRVRVDEALLRLRAGHCARAVERLDDTAFTLDEQRLVVDAAMNERLVEINVRREMFSVQKRALFEDCGRLRSEIREREQRIEQLVKRYDIFIGSLGKEESGQQVSVTYFKIKFAAERAALRERGAWLDADITRRERDVSALEATLRVVHAAHAHFMHHISPLQEDTPEMAELHNLTQQYYEMRDELKDQNAKIASLEQHVNESGTKLNMLLEKSKQLTAKEADTEQELENARDNLQRQESKLQNSRVVVKKNAKRARKLVEGVDGWRIFQLANWSRDYSAAAVQAVSALQEACGAREAARLACMLAATDLQRHLAPHQRHLRANIDKCSSGFSRLRGAPETAPESIELLTGVQEESSCYQIEESLFSMSAESSASTSVASGFTRRLAGFRRALAPKLKEPELASDVAEIAQRSSVTLRVVTLGLNDSSTSSRKFC